MAMEIHLFHPFPIGNTSSNGGFSIAMLVYQRVNHSEIHPGELKIGTSHSPKNFHDFVVSMLKKKSAEELVSG